MTKLELAAKAAYEYYTPGESWESAGIVRKERWTGIASVVLMEFGYQADGEGQRKPLCEVVGHDQNFYSVIGDVCRSLTENGMREKAKEFRRLVLTGQYNAPEELRKLVNAYVTPC